MSNVAPFVPSWIADLARAVSRLNGEQTKILTSNYRSDESTATPSTTQLQRSLSLSTTDAAHLARDLKQISSIQEVTGHDIGIALATLAQARSMAAATDERIEVVCTAPSRLGVPVRTTFATAIEMVKMARQEIFVVGYVFTEGASELIEQLAVARRDRGVRIKLIGNRIADQLAVLRALWLTGSPPPIIFSRAANPTDVMAALHAKLLICDSTFALVTSANFSYHGLHENIEIGVKIQSGAVKRLIEFLQAMIQMGEVEPVEWT